MPALYEAGAATNGFVSTEADNGVPKAIHGEAM